MEERRKLLKAVPMAALGIAAASLAGVAAEVFASPAAAANASGGYDPQKQRSVPDVLGVDHTGRAFRFYRDLVKDKVVTINFMSIQEEAQYPVTAKMSEIAHRLGDKLGSEVFMVSVTRTPEYDTPERLAEFAEMHNIPKGWVLVNCSTDGTHALQSRVYHTHHHGSPEGSADHKPAVSNTIRSTDIVFYGHGGLGLWSNFPVNLHPDEAVRHISWVMPGRKPTGDPKRAGPRQLNSSGLPADNRIFHKA